MITDLKNWKKFTLIVIINKNFYKVPRFNNEKKKIDFHMMSIKDPSEINFSSYNISPSESQRSFVNDHKRKYSHFYKGILSTKSKNSKTIDFSNISKDDEYYFHNDSLPDQASIISNI